MSIKTTTSIVIETHKITVLRPLDAVDDRMPGDERPHAHYIARTLKCTAPENEISKGQGNTKAASGPQDLKETMEAQNG